MPMKTPEAGVPSACPKPAPYTGKVRTYAKVLDAYITQINGLNRHQRDALYRLRLEAGAAITGFDASPHQLAKLWKCSLPTARAYIRAFIRKGMARQVQAHNRGARKAATFAFDFTGFPQFGDVLKKRTAPVVTAPVTPEPRKETVPSLERETPSLRSGDFSSRESNYSRKAPEGGPAAVGEPQAEKEPTKPVAEGILEHGTNLLQRVVGLDRPWARKAMVHAAGSFKTWEELEQYAQAVSLVMQKVQAKGTLQAGELPRMAFREMVRSKESRRRNKILREAGQVPAFLARLKARKEAQAELLAGSPLACQTAVVEGIRVEAPMGLPPAALQPYFAWVKAKAVVPHVEDPSYPARFDAERETLRHLLEVLEGGLGEAGRSAIERDLSESLRGSGLEPGGALWNRAWRRNRAKRVGATFGVVLE